MYHIVAPFAVLGSFTFLCFLSLSIAHQLHLFTLIYTDVYR